MMQAGQALESAVIVSNVNRSLIGGLGDGNSLVACTVRDLEVKPVTGPEAEDWTEPTASHSIPGIVSVLSTLIG